MRVVIQRAGHASVTINGTCKASIGKGLMILVWKRRYRLALQEDSQPAHFR